MSGCQNTNVETITIKDIQFLEKDIKELIDGN